jgi:hypothetical protein
MRLVIILVAFCLLSACSSPNECASQCGEAVCGDDGCGGSCGSCTETQTCTEGVCTAVGCGDGVLAETETCDDSTDRPCTPESYCESTNACLSAIYSGSVATCDAKCETTFTEECINDDGCCPSVCSPQTDSDCKPANCGNGVLDDRETCDPPEIPCPTECPNTDPCLTVALTGIAEACNAACTPIPITACYPSVDGCCPADCATTEDADCLIEACGNSIVDDGETCDNALIWPASGACTPDCDDNRACTSQSLGGSAETCSVVCAVTDNTVCVSGDGCCPATCDALNDTDCSNVVCADAIIDGTENCDSMIPAGYPGACPLSLADCDDSDPCTTDTLVGDAADCSAKCVNEDFACGAGDSCCPTSCTTGNDAECAALTLCDTYCANAMTYCVGVNLIYDTLEACQTACVTMPVGTDGDLTGPTLQCRIHHLMEAMNDADTHCRHAVENPTEACI